MGRGCDGHPERVGAAEQDKVRAGVAAQVTGAPRDERSVAAVTHCQFVVGPELKQRAGAKP